MFMHKENVQKDINQKVYKCFSLESRHSDDWSTR